ncbi:MAG: 3'(2'),5'-bisphosphate nucleotidase CysQ [Gammaproteobacteria bacterium]|nr:3'(2'),5'-bisphosphate nucleotidase CysQ [Gammaproteobacteria bacterium]
MLIEVEKLIPDVVQIAVNAGKAIMMVYNTEFEVEKKLDKSPVTQADLAAHDIIVAGLGALETVYPVLSEEEISVPFSTRRNWRTYWLVDPMDGTREFVKRNGEFVVSIALIHQHEAVLGVIYAPFLHTVYFASQHGGAYKQQAGDVMQSLQTRAAPITPVIAGSRSHSDKRMTDYLQKLGDHQLIAMGSALKSCLVAEGSADLYLRLGLTSEWDTAAAQCIVEEAGGYFVDTQGQRLLYNTKAELLNPEFLVYGDASRDWRRYLNAL